MEQDQLRGVHIFWEIMVLINLFLFGLSNVVNFSNLYYSISSVFIVRLFILVFILQYSNGRLDKILFRLIALYHKYMCQFLKSEMSLKANLEGRS